MQTLGICDSTVRTESRLKALFWPSIQTGTDVDYLGTQGYWVCTIVAVLSFLMSLVAGQLAAGLLIFFIYYLGGMGVRERDPFAATAVILIYVTDSVLTFLMFGLFSPGSIVLRTVIVAILVSNLRATFMAWSWKPDSEEAALPQRMNDTFADKLADQMPMWLWPKIRMFYYVVAAIYLVLICLSMVLVMLHLTVFR